MGGLTYFYLDTGSLLCNVRVYVNLFYDGYVDDHIVTSDILLVNEKVLTSSSI